VIFIIAASAIEEGHRFPSLLIKLDILKRGEGRRLRRLKKKGEKRKSKVPYIYGCKENRG
jgi:hypothetical protein